MATTLASALPVLRLPAWVYRDVTTVLVGTMANWILFGFLSAQVYFYYIAFPDDRLILKSAVFLELMLETVQTVAVTHDVFVFFTTDPLVINQIGSSWYSIPLLTGLIACLAQAFYCYRVAVFTRWKYAVALIGTLSLCQLGAAVSVSIQTKHTNLISNVLGTDLSLITIGVWGASSLVCDVLIAAIMTYYLKKRDMGFKEPRYIIKRTIRLAIETGCITASLAGISLALVYLPGHPPYYQVAALILGKTYSSSMVASLNSRVKVMSNLPAEAHPAWNESARLTSSQRSRIDEGIVFERSDETSNSSAYTA